MINLESLFIESKGQPVEVSGKLVYMVDRISISKSQRVTVSFESKSSVWRQGIHLSTVGMFEVNGQKIRNAIVLWEDSAPQSVEFSIISRDGLCNIKNVWDVGDGVMHSWHGGAGMQIVEDEFGRHYFCNDGHAELRFDNLVFSVRLG
ncbi:MAG: hypothetical protein ACN6OP_21095 [Pseudomonadales bacterium]|uniref:hypothetical protein n=1 Tax=Achromobacter mucicolens TaxID=1389922 RepID=UPI0020A265AC|nr:hypothetical protein [Achromobacter mucicolens]MCP2517545.1 hypothetical protein [Achromobacter mucicolens]